MLWTSSRCGNNCQMLRYHTCRLHTGARRRHLHCIQTLPVDICRWARHRSWMTSTRLRTRARSLPAATPLSGGRAGNWLEDAFSQGQARSFHRLIQTQLCTHPRWDSSWSLCRDVDEWWSNQISTWRVQDQVGSVLLCSLSRLLQRNLSKNNCGIVKVNTKTVFNTNLSQRRFQSHCVNVKREPKQTLARNSVVNCKVCKILYLINNILILKAVHIHLNTGINCRPNIYLYVTLQQN